MKHLSLLYLPTKTLAIITMKFKPFHSVFTYIILLSFITFSCTDDNNQNSSSNTNFKGLELLNSSQTGIDFRNTLNDDPLGNKNVLSSQFYYNGGGVGLADFDNDGLTDIVFTGNEVNNKIYRNTGNLKFEDKTENAGINENKNWSSGVSIIDINNDGLQDIYISQCFYVDDKEKMRNLFYINQGDFKFKESAKELGLDDAGIGTQAAFFDMDKDGDLDVYLLNENKYVLVQLETVFKELKDKEKLKAASGQMYRNDNGKFINITEEAGMLERSFGLGVLVSDFNNDNYPDIYVANDFTVPDRLYINQKNGTFKDQIKDKTDHISFYSMGCDIADFNNDGFQDLAVVDMATSDHFRGKTLMASMDSKAFNSYVKILKYQYQYMFNSFQINNGDGTFSNIAGFTGVQKTDWSWAALFADMNGDGLKDYYVSNGYKKYARDNDFRIEMEKIRSKNGGTVPLEMRKEMYEKMPTIRLRNLLYMNEGDLHFEENPKQYNYPDVGTFSYGAAYGDLDNDGDLELVVNNIDDEAHIIKNNTRENNAANYLSIKLKSPENPTLKQNSLVYIYYGDEVQVNEYSFVRGYLSSMEQRLFYGLNKVKEIDRIVVKWSDGKIQELGKTAVNQELEISYAPNKNSFENNRLKIQNLTKISDNSKVLEWVHKENDFEDFAKEVLLPQKQSTMGPAISVADVNQDGLDDIFLGGAAGQASSFYLQSEDGSFLATDAEYFNGGKFHEDNDAVFIDINGDKLDELLVASGGSGEMVNNEMLLQDRSYVIDKGIYKKAKMILPESTSSTYRIKKVDLDKDGLNEVFTLGAAKPGKYPLSETNTILKSDKRKFTDETKTLAPDFKNIPLVRDVEFSDFNKDGIEDFICVSEWGKPEIFVSNNGQYSLATDQYIKDEKYGWWQSVTKVDIDNDGDDDFILGNIGKNIKHKVSDKKPLYLYANDFDKNGTLDVVLAKEYKGKIVPARGKECSTEQMPFIENKIKTYKEFANSDIVDILGEKSVEESNKYKATTFGSYALINNNGAYEFQELPSYAQIAPIYDMEVLDINKDGYMDIIAVGNNYDTEYETPRLDAGRGVVLLNKNGERFEALMPYESGFSLDGNFRKVKIVNRKNDKLIIAAQNNGPIEMYSFK